MVTDSPSSSGMTSQQASLRDYVVFARKYRPQTLHDVVGQDTLVRALEKALADNQLSHALLLHGIRGVGKTTTARIIAKGLNCEKGPTINPCGTCTSCQAIQNDRHLDVIEMDAASHTGVDDVREVIETAKYRAVQGRFKVYIIDEVHMLSKSAFNALLKTLEEPPPFVKFIFATTELQKVPETILSRCMRFDLKRMDIKTITDRVQTIMAAENLSIDKDAATLIARAAEGSMRDALSLLDQAFVLSKGTMIETETVRNMLGLSSRDHIYTLLQMLFEGNIAQTLLLTDDLYENGSDPILLLKDLLDALYGMIAVKATPSLLTKGAFTEGEQETISTLLNTLTMPSLLHVWQILNDRFDKIYRAPFPSQALQVLLMQVCYTAHLPPLADILAVEQVPQPQINAEQRSVPQQLEKSIAHPNAAPSMMQESVSPLSHIKNLPETVADLLSFIKDKRELILYANVHSDIAVQSYAPGHIRLHTKPNAPKNFAYQLKIFLEKQTEHPWVIDDMGPSTTAPSIKDTEEKIRIEKHEHARNHHVVKDILDTFPGAKIRKDSED